MEKGRRKENKEKEVSREGVRKIKWKGRLEGKRGRDVNNKPTKII